MALSETVKRRADQRRADALRRFDQKLREFGGVVGLPDVANQMLTALVTEVIELRRDVEELRARGFEERQKIGSGL